MDDEDQVRAFIADVNLESRDLKKGQKAMLYAMLFPDPNKRARGNKAKSTESVDFSQQQLREARQVLRHSKALADDVIADRVPLDAALQLIKDEQTKARSIEAKTERLRAARAGPGRWPTASRSIRQRRKAQSRRSRPRSG
jgi:hypothetical protein